MLLAPLDPVLAVALAAALVFAPPQYVDEADEPAALEIDGTLQTPRRPQLATRADLARSYLRFEQALARRPDALAREARRLNEAFDRATLAFFTGSFAATCQQLDALALDVDGGGEAGLLRFAASLRVAGLPAVIVAPDPAAAAPLALTLSPLYPVPDAWPAIGDLELQLVALPLAASSPPAWRAPVVFDRDGLSRSTLPIAALPAARGRFALQLVAADGAPIVVATTTLARASFDRAREALLAELAGLPPAPELAAARATLRSRAALLSDAPSSWSSAQLLAAPLDLLRALHRELAALRDGRDPYVALAGHLWRELEVDGRPIALRTYAPAALARADAPPAGVVVALHGAGGDENLFMEGYGAGSLARLADAHGFLAVAPQTSAIAGDARRFDALIDDVARLYAIDRRRLFVVGHSMGAMAAAQLAAARASSLAAVVCFAGGSFRDGPLAPTLLVAGAIDPIVRPGPLLAGARAAIARGLPLTVKELPDGGHTLLVAAELSPAIEWLLDHSLAAR